MNLPADQRLLEALLSLTNVNTLSPEDRASVDRFKVLKMVTISKEGWVQFSQPGLSFLQMSGMITVPAPKPADEPAPAAKA